MVDLTGKTQLNSSVNRLLGPGKTTSPPAVLTQRRWRLDLTLLAIWLPVWWLVTYSLGLSDSVVAAVQVPLIFFPTLVHYLTMRHFALVRTVDELVLVGCKGLMPKASIIISRVDEATVQLHDGGTFRRNLVIADRSFLANPSDLLKISVS